MKCYVCGFEKEGEMIQCRRCGSILSKKGFINRIQFFRRLNELELQNQKQAAAIKKLWELIEEKKKPSPLILEDDGSQASAKTLIDYILRI